MALCLQGEAMATTTERPAQRLQTAVGQPLTIELSALPGAGFLWQMPAVPAGCSLQAGPSGPAGPGVGGAVPQRFVFSAIQAGPQTLRFALQRAWEAAPSELQAVHIDVG
jgi:predicted secreted protein